MTCWSTTMALTRRGLARQNWVNNVMDWGTAEENTNLAYLVSGKLTPLLALNTAVFKCPSDRALAENGPRTRSYSMNSLVGNPGVLTNKFNPGYAQFFKPTEIRAPASTFVFLDEHPDTLQRWLFHEPARSGHSGATCRRRTTTARQTCHSRTDTANRIAGWWPTRSARR